MAKRSGIKASGERCRNRPKNGSVYCPSHDPERAQARSEAASHAAKHKGPGREIAEAKRRIRDLAEGVIEGRVDRGKASVAFQGWGVLKGFIELERRLWETQELANRIEELELTIQTQRQETGGSWLHHG